MSPALSGVTILLWSSNLVYSYSPYYSLYISQGNNRENLLDNQDLLKLVIISFILIIFVLDSSVIM